MAQFCLDARFPLPTLANLRDEWRNVPDGTVRSHIALEEHYLRFHCWLLNELRVDSVNAEGDPEMAPLRGATRAGALRAATLLYAAISEAALLAHANARDLSHPDPNQERRRDRWTFGTIIEVWQRSRAPEFRAIEPQLLVLRDARNRVHLQRAIADAQYWPDVINSEARVIEAGELIIPALRDFRSP